MDKQQAWYQGWPVVVEEKDGPGRGWWGPPKGTHGPGKKGTETIPLKAKASAQIALKRGMSGRDWMDHAQKIFRKPAYTRKQTANAWEAMLGKYKGQVPLKLKASAAVAHRKGQLPRDWMDKVEKLFTVPLYTREQLSAVWESITKKPEGK